MEIEINNKYYKVLEDEKDTIKEIDLNEIVTDYYNIFDYIVGDWAYGKVRLKGFYKHENKKVKDYNDIAKLDEYLQNNCAYGCKYFVLEKISNKIIEKEN